MSHMSLLLKCHLCENFPIEIDREVKFSWSLMTFPVRLPVHPPDQKPIQLWDPADDQEDRAKYLADIIPDPSYDGRSWLDWRKI